MEVLWSLNIPIPEKVFEHFSYIGFKFVIETNIQKLESDNNKYHLVILDRLRKIDLSKFRKQNICFYDRKLNVLYDMNVIKF